MRVAGLFDVHGNLPALEAVLADLEGEDVDTIVLGGDVASGPMPGETLALLRSQSVSLRFVRGNADRVLDFAGFPGGDLELWKRSRLWVAERLGAADLSFLAGLPLDVVVDVEGLGSVRFCHGAPGSDELVITKVTPDERLRRLVESVDERVVVCGHTHVQFDRSVDGVRIVNAGSVARRTRPRRARTGSSPAPRSTSGGRATTSKTRSAASGRRAFREPGNSRPSFHSRIRIARSG